MAHPAPLPAKPTDLGKEVTKEGFSPPSTFRIRGGDIIGESPAREDLKEQEGLPKESKRIKCLAPLSLPH